jgi:(4-(4-[2-(gamma-L-glutamylamino)ethyl]phenoxymethyl)furan-2-yl)methanamine synthase
MRRIFGWDLGGANVKLARAEDGSVAEVAQIPCPDLPDRGKFDAAVATALKLTSAPAIHAVTMTGELSDVFHHREEGVDYLVELMRKAVVGERLLIYGGKAGLLAPKDATRRTFEVASANWHATAELIARRCSDALLVDVGTTTTDLIPIKQGAVASRGSSDRERLTESELVYTGVVRTPVMAIAQTATFAGRVQQIAAERFATMADVWRLTGDLPDDADPYPAADRRGKSAAESAARLARMLGCDAGNAEPGDWVALARQFAECQLRLIEEAARTVSAREHLPVDAPVIGAGCGLFLATKLALRLGRPYVDFADIVPIAPEAREAAARAAPAAAVALLASPR